MKRPINLRGICPIGLIKFILKDTNIYLISLPMSSMLTVNLPQNNCYGKIQKSVGAVHPKRDLNNNAFLRWCVGQTSKY